ncbi:hypothetical protein QYF36_026165 [Acer negundo]|nr:hypothetical protein QYF36_026165 [Acer negundo]
MMKEDFAKRIQLMKDDIEQRDKALSFMKYKELDYIEKLDIVEQSLKVLTNESIKPTAEIVLDKHQGGSSVPEIINKSDPIARRRKRNKKKRQSLPQRQNYHEAMQTREGESNEGKTSIDKEEEIERGGINRLIKSDEEYMVITSPLVKESLSERSLPNSKSR